MKYLVSVFLMVILLFMLNVLSIRQQTNARVVRIIAVQYIIQDVNGNQTIVTCDALIALNCR